MRAGSIRNTILFMCFITIILTLAIIGTLLSPGPLKHDAKIIIPSGASLRNIAQRLHSQRVIKHPNLFVAYSYATQSQGHLRSGEYFIPAKSDLTAIARLLRKNSNVSYKITAIEGMRSSEIITQVNNHPKLAGNDISTTYPEGSLAPDTYKFQYGDRKEKIIAIMHEAMKEIYQDIAFQLPSLHEQYPAIKSIEDVITLASIVEKEAGFDEERPLIAAAFLNRLKKNMRLQADPTVVYAIEIATNRTDITLSKQDLKFDSPYNTYVSRGLPPGPIACPGRKSIDAVLKPAKVDYLYFVSNNQGGHNFSSNLKEHNKNVTLYRKLQKQAAQS